MLYVKESSKSLEQVGQGLESAAQKHKFGVLAVHNLKETMAKKGVEIKLDCLIYEVCNPFQAKKVLEANPLVSTALPCRISIFTEGGKTKLATILPTQMLRGFNSPQLEPVAREVEQVIVAMMDEAAS
jgi:uncharacterized protein (DUF302 family)